MCILPYVYHLPVKSFVRLMVRNWLYAVNCLQRNAGIPRYLNSHSTLSPNNDLLFFSFNPKCVIWSKNLWCNYFLSRVTRGCGWHQLRLTCPNRILSYVLLRRVTRYWYYLPGSLWGLMPGGTTNLGAVDGVLIIFSIFFFFFFGLVTSHDHCSMEIQFIWSQAKLHIAFKRSH